MDRLISLWKEEQAILQRQLEMLELGELRTHERRWPDRLDEVDTTAETKARVTGNLAELEALLGRYSSDPM
jgi:hypothetical protein